MASFLMRILIVPTYFLIFPFFALIVRLVGDPLGLKRAGPKGWKVRREIPGNPMERARRRY